MCSPQSPGFQAVPRTEEVFTDSPFLALRLPRAFGAFGDSGPMLIPQMEVTVRRRALRGCRPLMPCGSGWEQQREKGGLGAFRPKGAGQGPSVFSPLHSAQHSSHTPPHCSVPPLHRPHSHGIPQGHCPQSRLPLECCPPPAKSLLHLPAVPASEPFLTAQSSPHSASTP